MKKILLFILVPFLSFGQIKIGLDINGLASGDTSGSSVSISADGSFVAVGSHLSDANGIDSGCVRIYRNVSGTWVQQGANINGEAAGNQFGGTVSLSADGSTIAIGATRNTANGTNSGHVRVYKNISGSWIQQGTDIDGQTAGDQSGWSVSLSPDGTIVAIGSPYNANNGNDSGLVRVYKNIAGVWTQDGSDINSGSYYDASGRSVSLSSDGSIVAIGSPYNSSSGAYSGRVRIYKNVAGVWTQQGTDILGASANGISGYSVSLSSDGTTVAIGAIGNSSSGSNAGYARVYKNISGVWTQQGATINGVAVNNSSGRSVSLSADGTILAIGANGNSDNGLSSGHVRIYRFVSSSWILQGIAITGEAAGDNSGASVALAANGSTLIIGSPNNATNGTNAGQARVYDISALLASDSFALQNFSIYPNPTTATLNISFQEDIQLQKVTIYNALGQLVKESKSTTVDVSSLSEATYFVEVITNKGKATRSIIKK